MGSRLTVEIQNQFLGFATSNPMCSCPILQHLTVWLEAPLLTGHLIGIIRWSCQIAVIFCEPSSFRERKKSIDNILLLSNTRPPRHSPQSRKSNISVKRRGFLVLGPYCAREDCCYTIGHYMSKPDISLMLNSGINNEGSSQTVRIAGTMSNFSNNERSAAVFLCER